MDLQEYLERAVAEARDRKMANSDQLTLGEMIAKLEPIVEAQKDKKPEDEALVIYDFEYLYPTHIDSWRGSYNELALNFVMGGDDNLKVSAFLQMLKETVGQEFTGYKGGEYVMTEKTPVWVANYGNAGSTAVIEIVDSGYEVIIITGRREF